MSWKSYRVPSQRVFRQSTNASDGEVNVIGTQKANVKWPTRAATKVHPNGRLTRIQATPELVKELAQEADARPRYLSPTFVPTLSRTRDERGRFISHPKKPTHSIATGRPLR